MARVRLGEPRDEAGHGDRRRRRRERPVSTRRRSRSAPRPSAPAAVTGRRRSSRAASARHRLRAGGRSRRPPVLSAALRRRTPPVRRRRRRRRRCLRGPAPRHRPRRCAGSRLRRLHAWGETSRAVCPGTRRAATNRSYAQARDDPAIAVRDVARPAERHVRILNGSPASRSPERLNPHERSLTSRLRPRAAACALTRHSGLPDLDRMTASSIGCPVPRTTVRPRCGIT